MCRRVASPDVGWDDIREAFQRAVTLAPRMSRYRLHLLDGAFRYHADSAHEWPEAVLAARR